MAQDPRLSPFNPGEPRESRRSVATREMPVMQPRVFKTDGSPERRWPVGAAIRRNLACLPPDVLDLPDSRPLTIEVNGRPLCTVRCSPMGSIELAIGRVFAEGFIRDAAQVQRVTPYSDRVSLMLTPAACPDHLSQQRAPIDEGNGDPSNRGAGLRVPRECLMSLTEQVFTRFDREPNAVGNHFVALCDLQRMRVLGNDVDPHNAVDKLVGWAILQQVDRSQLLFYLSGKIGVDVASRICRAGFPIAVSRLVSTADAVEIATTQGAMLVGRALENRPAIYSNPWRILDDEN